MNIVAIILFAAITVLFIYLDVRGRAGGTLKRLLRILLPMLISGVVVKIINIFYKVPFHDFDLISMIIALPGFLFLHLLFRSIFQTEQKSRFDKKGGNAFLSALSGLARGWLLGGSAVLYLVFFLILLGWKGQPVTGPVFMVLTLPARWLLLFDFRLI